MQNIKVDSSLNYDAKKLKELLNEVGKALGELPNFIKEQSLLYSNFNKTFYSELEKRKNILSKELGRI